MIYTWFPVFIEMQEKIKVLIILSLLLFPCSLFPAGRKSIIVHYVHFITSRCVYLQNVIKILSTAANRARRTGRTGLLRKRNDPFIIDPSFL